MDISGVLPMILYYLGVRREHPPSRKYNILVSFFLGHILMVILAGWANFVSMITGWKKSA